MRASPEETVTVSEYTVAEPSVDGPTVGMAVQFVLLAGVSVTVGLSLTGWLVGTAFALVVWTTLTFGLRRAGMRELGAANRVTLARSTLVGCVAALVADSLRHHDKPVIFMVVIAAVALALDNVDGQVARRTGTSSALGARFDMEVDAILILALSVFVAGHLGLWVLAIGALRYAFVVAGWALPWLCGDLPARYSRKVVAALQGVVLAVAASGWLPGAVSFAAVAFALAALCWSFGRDTVSLLRSKRAVERREAQFAGGGPLR
jgi:phosphatidylglycerophosphate synthase